MDRQPSVPGPGSDVDSDHGRAGPESDPVPLVRQAASAWAGWAVASALLALALGILANIRVIDLDVFHEMALIREALALGRIPTEDVFAYTPTVSPSVHHEWGTGAVLYLVTVVLGGGTYGLAVLRFLLLAAIAACVVATARRRGAGGEEMAILAPLGMFMCWTGLAPIRAHLFTFLFTALLLLLLEVERRGDRRWILAWPLLFVIWLNMHGGFVVGAGLLGVYTLERTLVAARRFGWREAIRRNRHIIGAAGVILPLLLLNPYGWDYIPYIWEALLLDRPFIAEWNRIWEPPFRTLLFPAYLVSLLLLAYALIRGQGRRSFPGIGMLMIAAVFAARSGRVLPIYAVVWMSYVPAALAGSPLSVLVRSWWERRARPAGAAALVAAVLGTAYAASDARLTVDVPTTPVGRQVHYPQGAVEYLAEVGFQGNLMTPFRVGAFVSWNLYPDVLVGMDSRYEVAYPPALVEETMRVYDGHGEWAEFLVRFPTDAVLVPTGAPLDGLLVRAFRNSGKVPTWREVYRDDGFAVFAHRRLASELPMVDRRGHTPVGRFP
jgi:hypothetical protein